MKLLPLAYTPTTAYLIRKYKDFIAKGWYVNSILQVCLANQNYVLDKHIFKTVLISFSLQYMV